MNCVNVLDVTLRDGSYVCSKVPDGQSGRALVDRLLKSGIGLCEIGYFRRSNPKFYAATGPRVCDKDYLSHFKGAKGLVLMVRPGDVELDHYQEISELNIELIRIPICRETLDWMKPHVKLISEMNISLAFNITRASEKNMNEILSLALAAEDLGAKYVYVADSNGAIFPDRIEKIFEGLSSKLHSKLGFHPHNNISMAFINSVMAIKNGATIVDSSIFGMGKGGNLHTELITNYLMNSKGGTYDMEAMSGCQDLDAFPWLIPSRINQRDIRLGLYNLNLENAHKLDNMNPPVFSQIPTFEGMER